jgi:Zn-dependent peptidase ImmA (M78 family)
MKTTNQIIKINPLILVWARESIGLSIGEVAVKLKKDVNTIVDWEKGGSIPSLAQLEKLAYSIYKRPLAVFFMKNPPQESNVKEDFRTISDEEVEFLTPKLRMEIRKAKNLQLQLNELHNGKNPIEKPLFKDFIFTLNSDPIKSAETIRKILGLSKRLKISFRNSEEAFNYYRELIELNGIYVFQFPLNNVRGFSLVDNEFPVIILNSGDSFNGKIFTIFHELCHILFNTGGIFRDVITQEFKINPDKIEVFCNKFASEILLPEKELVNEEILISIKKTEWEDSELEIIANKYKVSKEVVLRKLLDLGRTTKACYLEARKRWKGIFLKNKEKQKEKQMKSKSGPTYHITNFSHLGKNFVTDILSQYHKGKIDQTQVADILSIKINKIPVYEQRVF